ncbi:protein PHYTOCHROME-DEPENDENT LATE-FLOWERING-like [Mangifera indica]|uniref:protein PHYTOCHROME-DEPENDENT LATE-FLOWERING-like n=1 Tax=Mangifera indica TaxID=29780 RepID=UPI001CFBC756|nr:protein PHYTOCHROME-DEPENDENT LATE-FLOWERING-like [Mangifera indica]
MGFSFKLTRKGKRYRPEPSVNSGTCVDEVSEACLDDGSENSRPSSRIRKSEGEDVGVSHCSEGFVKSTDQEASVILNLYTDGFFIEKPLEKEAMQQVQEASKKLLPYDKASDIFLVAVESGQLPLDFPDTITGEYVGGRLMCEVRDYRNCESEQGSTSTSPPMPGFPIAKKVQLRVTLENVVKDVSLVSADSWSYADLMDVESEIVNAMNPQLCLDPTLKLDRLSTKSVNEKLELSLRSLRKKRYRQMQEANRLPESSHSRLEESAMISDIMMPHASENMTKTLVSNQLLPLKPKNFAPDASIPLVPLVTQQSRYQIGVGISGMQDHGPNSIVNPSGASVVGQEMISYAENMNSTASFQGKRESQDGQLSPLSGYNNRARLNLLGSDGIQHQHIGTSMDNLHGTDGSWKKTLLEQPVMVGSDASHLEMQQSRLQQRLSQHACMRTGFTQPWNTMVQHVEKDSRKEDQFQKRKTAQSPRLSSGALPQSPLSSKSGEFSSSSVGPHFGVVATSASLASHKEKPAVSSVPVVSSANESMQRQPQVSTTNKRRSNSLPKTPGISGVGSPASVSNISVPLNANSPSVGTPPLSDQSILDKFLKIESVVKRYQLNSKKNKVDDCQMRKPNTYSTQNLLVCLRSVSNNEDFKDELRPLSKSLLGGSMNISKSRVLNFVIPERILQGNVVSIVRQLRTRMVMLEKVNDGTVAMYCGDKEDGDILAVEEYLPILPNTHSADLLATQYSSLMIREGCLVEDLIHIKPSRMSFSSSGQPSSVGVLPNNNSGAEMQQYTEAVSGQAIPSEVAKPALNSSQNLLASTRMLPPGNPQAAHMSQGLVSGISMPVRPQQLDSQQSVQSQQQQQPANHHLFMQQQQQLQRSSMMLGPNSVSNLNSNMPLGNQMVNNKTSALQLQMLQPQQQTQMQRKMMMGLGTAVGMGNMGNNMVGLGGLSNAMSMGGARGLGAGMSAPMAPISNMGNVASNSMNLNQAANISNVISQQFRSGKITPQAALVASKIRSQRMLGPAGISGARQMLPGLPGSTGLSSMLCQNLNRTNMNPMQRTAMGPPKLMTVMNPYMSQQQQQQMQQQQLQHQQLQQQQLQQQLQHQMHQQQQLLHQPPQQPPQETTSPLQAVVSPSQVGSPSTMGITQLNQQSQQQLSPQLNQQLQQQLSPQQFSQRTSLSPQQLSSGAIHAISAGNQEPCPTSPQLSSQTLGSVGSITNSPMDLHGVNKS